MANPTNYHLVVQSSADDLRVSALSPDAATFRVSALGVNIADVSNSDAADFRVSSFQTDAANLNVSAKSGDAGTFRVSALGVNISDVSNPDAGDFLVSAKQGDAALLRISAIGTITVSAHEVKQSDAASLRVSAIVDSGSVSAKSGDAGTLRVSALVFDGEYSAAPNTIVSARGTTPASAMKGILASIVSPDAAFTQVSAKSDAANLFRVSAIVDSGSVSAKSSDAGTFRVSAIGTVTVSAHEVKQSDAASLLVSAKTDSAAQLRVSAFVDSGSVSARQSDAANLNVSAKSQDGALFRTSAVQDGAAALNVSAKSDSANLLRVSSLAAAHAATGGGASKSFTVRQAATATTVKSSAGNLYGWALTNEAGVIHFLQFFNVSGGPTVGTDTPFLSFGVPSTGAANVWFNPPVAFSTGIVIAATSTVSGSTAAASGMNANIFYV